MRTYYYLSFFGNEVIKFINIVKKYILPEYTYKIDIKKQENKYKLYYKKNYEKYWAWKPKAKSESFRLSDGN